MAKPGREATKRRGRAIKETMVAEMVSILQQGKGFVLCNNLGLTLAQATKLRADARKQKVAVKVIKNTLLGKAFTQVGLDPEKFKDLLTRETVIVVGLEDPVSPAKLVMEFSEKNEKLAVKGGYVEGTVMNAAQVEALSKLPGREQLLQRALGSFLSPVQNFVYLCNAIVAKPVHLLDAIRRSKEAA